MEGIVDDKTQMAVMEVTIILPRHSGHIEETSQYAWGGVLQYSGDSRRTEALHCQVEGEKITVAVIGTVNDTLASSHICEEMRQNVYVEQCYHISGAEGEVMGGIAKYGEERERDNTT